MVCFNTTRVKLRFAVKALEFDETDPKLPLEFRQQAQELKKKLLKELYFLNLNERKALRR